MLKKHGGGLPSKIEMYIRIHVASLYKTNLFQYQERDDLLQELALFYIERFYKKDEDIPDELLFIAIKRKAQQILRSRLLSMKSGVFFNESLNSMSEEKGFELTSKFCLEDLENEIDLKYLLKMLSEKEQEFIKRLFQGEKLNDVYQSLKMSKGTPKRIAEKIKKKI